MRERERECVCVCIREAVGEVWVWVSRIKACSISSELDESDEPDKVMWDY